MKKPYSVVSNYFDEITTDEQAYWLGFIAADGTVLSKQRGFDVRLCQKDAGHLDRLKSAIAPNAEVKPIYYDESKSFHRSPMFRLTICDKHMGQILTSYNLQPGKEYRNWWPNLSDDLLISFVAGVFDGDGCLGRYPKWSWSIVGPEQVISETRSLISRSSNITGGSVRSHERSSHLFELRYNGSEAVAASFLLGNRGTPLKRKRIPDNQSVGIGWSPNMILMLREMYPKAPITPSELLSAFPSFTISQIHKAAALFNCDTEMGSRWKRSEFDLVRELYPTDISVKDLSILIGKSESKIRNMAKGQLKVRRPGH